MKSIFKFGAVAALTLFAASCAKDQFASENETVETSFAVEVPGGVISTKGLSDASEINELVCQVFTVNSDKTLNPITDLFKTVEVVDCKAKVSFSLVKGQKYTFAFWAQAAGTGYYDTADLRAVKMNVANVKANDPKMDAYFGTAEGKIISAASTSESLPLYRAVAQVNFGAEDLNRADALEVEKSKITLTDVPTVFNAAAGNKDNAYSEPAKVLFAVNPVVNERLLVSDKEYNYLATCYVFAPKDQILTDAEAVFYLSNGKDRSAKAPNAPIKRNARTNILGNLLTVNMDWNITIDSEFKGGDIFYDSVSANLEKGGNVTLDEDYTVAAESAGVAIPLGATSTLNLNGKKFANENGATANKAALQVHGELTINGEGEVYCEGGATNNAIIVEQGGNLVINGGIYSVGKASNGTSNATIYVAGPDTYGRTGTVKIYGGTFSAEAGTDGTPFVLNQSDKITEPCIFVYGGTFIGFNPAEVNEAHGAITSFVADGYRSVETTYEGKQAWTVEAIPAAGTQDEFEDAISAAVTGETAVIPLTAGEFTTYNKTIGQGKTLTFVGAGVDNTTYTCGYNPSVVGSEYGADYSLENSDVTFKNMKVATQMSENYRGFVRPKSLTFENCVIEGRFTYLGSGKVVFTNCVFNTTAVDYNLWLYSAKEYVFDGCTFNCNGKCINAYREDSSSYKITVRNCTFNSTQVYKSAIELKANKSAKYELYFEGTNICADTNFKSSIVTGSTLYNSNDSETDSIVYVEGNKVWENGAKVSE